MEIRLLVQTTFLHSCFVWWLLPSQTASPPCSIHAYHLFPSEWKQANVTPVPKSGNTHLVNNFRSVSVIPVLATVIETVVHRQLYEYLVSHRLLNPAQSGFHPFHNTQDVILKTIDDWKLAMDKGKIVGTVMIDLSKVFDSIDHSLLLAKLSAYGVCGTELTWFTNYLNNRKQRVVLSGIASEWGSVLHLVNH